MKLDGLLFRGVATRGIYGVRGIYRVNDPITVTDPVIGIFS